MTATIRAVLFAGPTLGAGEIERLVAESSAGPTVVVEPPVAQGDLARVVMRDDPQVIGLIDGVYERVTAVWHKEILWALSRGVHVLGAASMGALRAAETARFGTIGIGRIAAWYASGACTRDDDVAVAHLLAEHDYRPVTVATVEVIATVAAAVQAGALDAVVGERVTAACRALHYTDRRWPTIIAAAGLPPAPALADQDDLCVGHDRRPWWRQHRVDLKRRDALELVRRLVDGDWSTPVRPDFAFAETDQWLAVSPQADLVDEPDDELMDAGLLRVLARILYSPAASADADAWEGRLRDHLGDRVDRWPANQRRRIGADQAAVLQAWGLHGRAGVVAAEDVRVLRGT